MLCNPNLRGPWTMTPSQIRDAVRTLQTQGLSLREISRVLKLSRNTVRRILRAPFAGGGRGQRTTASP